MDITYLGAGAVKLSGKQLNVVVDPYDESTGLGKLKATADVTVVTSPDVKGPKLGMVVDGPGEYEVKGSLITGTQAKLHVDGPDDKQRATIYTIELDDVDVAVTGNIAAELSDAQVEAIGNVDVLVVPVGGHGLTLDATGAAQMVSRLEPKFVIPVHYDDGKTKYAMPQDDLKKFLDEMGASPEPIGKLKLNAKELPEETTVVVLEHAGA